MSASQITGERQVQGGDPDCSLEVTHSHTQLTSAPN